MENTKQPTGNELIAVPLAVLNTVLEYLSKRPYDEVAMMINAVQTKSRMVTEPVKGDTGSKDVVPETPVVVEDKK